METGRRERVGRSEGGGRRERGRKREKGRGRRREKGGRGRKDIYKSDDVRVGKGHEDLNFIKKFFGVGNRGGR